VKFGIPLRASANDAPRCCRSPAERRHSGGPQGKARLRESSARHERSFPVIGWRARVCTSLAGFRLRCRAIRPVVVYAGRTSPHGCSYHASPSPWSTPRNQLIGQGGCAALRKVTAAIPRPHAAGWSGWGRAVQYVAFPVCKLAFPASQHGRASPSRCRPPSVVGLTLLAYQQAFWIGRGGDEVLLLLLVACPAPPPSWPIAVSS
jgi:hypothetical protein